MVAGMIGSALRALFGMVAALPATQSVVNTTGKILVKDDDVIVRVAGSGGAATAAAAAISSATIRPGRRLLIQGTHDTNTVTISRTAAASSANGTVTLGAATRALGNQDILEIIQQNDGSWSEVNFTDNT